MTSELELTVVMPCLNEEDTVGTCVTKALKAMQDASINGEVVIADNGSTDRSKEIAESLGARVVPVSARGYGNALMGGINSAKGKFVIMGDADDSYDFLEIPKFVEGLRAGADLVQGCRLPGGGGTVAPGAMPWSHRWIGNPALTQLVRFMFNAPIHDVYCGLRGFTKECYDSLAMRCTGMEFATEMIIKCSLFEKRITEVPITLHPDGRKSHPPHLRTLRDGWRTLRFFLMYSPKWLFMIPGLILLLIGVLGYGLALPGMNVFGVNVDAHTLLVSSMMMVLGLQSCSFGLFSKAFAIEEGLMPEHGPFASLARNAHLERGLLIGGALVLVGVCLIAAVASQWFASSFGDLDYPKTMRLVVPGVTSVIMGFQIVLASFLLGVLRLGRR